MLFIEGIERAVDYSGGPLRRKRSHQEFSDTSDPPDLPDLDLILGRVDNEEGPLSSRARTE